MSTRKQSVEREKKCKREGRRLSSREKEECRRGNESKRTKRIDGKTKSKEKKTVSKE